MTIHTNSQKPIELEIDSALPRVRVGGLVLRRAQWALFYALLGTRAEAASDQRPTAVNREELARYMYWKAKTPRSIGAEVARHLQKLHQDGMPIIGFHRKTDGWWLRPEGLTIKWVPNRSDVLAWLQMHVQSRDMDIEMVETVGTLARATAQLVKGRYEEVAETLGSSVVQHDSPLFPWYLVTRAQAATRADLEDDLEAVYDLWEVAQQAGIFDPSVEGLLQATRAYRQRYTSAAEQAAELNKAVALLEERGDLTGAAIAYNILGLLLRRSSQLEQAVGYYAKAIPRFGIAENLYYLQASLFNLSIVFDSLTVGDEVDERAVMLARSCLEVATAGGVVDSIQCEAMLSRWLIRTGRVDEAEKLIMTAETTIAQIEDDFEQAVFLRASGFLHETKGEFGKARKAYRSAARLFESFGDNDSAENVRREMEGIKTS